MPAGGGRNRPMLPLQMITVLLLVAMAAVSVHSPAAQAIPTHEDCKCFMCVCDLDPHPQPPEVPSHHQPPPVPSPPPPTPSPPPPALPAYYPPTEHEPAPGYYYYPPMPYGYPWQGGYPTTYGPPAGELYPREGKAYRSGAARRHGGHGLSCLLLAVAALSLLVLAA